MTDNRQYLQKLLIFDLWCTRKLTDLLRENNDFASRQACIAFLSHIINAQRIWFDRVLDLKISTNDLWHNFKVRDLKPEAKEIHQMWIDLIGDHDMDLNAAIVYQNSRGVTFKNRFVDICNHLILHGQHHRAQINLLLRQSGIEPPATDYINYLRRTN